MRPPAVPRRTTIWSMAATAIPRKGREPTKRVCCQNFQAPTMACIIALGGLFRPSPQAGQIFSYHDVSICSFNFMRYRDKNSWDFPVLRQCFPLFSPLTIKLNQISLAVNFFVRYKYCILPFLPVLSLVLHNACSAF